MPSDALPWSALLSLMPALPAAAAISFGASAMIDRPLSERAIANISAFIFSVLLVVSSLAAVQVLSTGPINTSIGDWFSIDHYTFHGGFFITPLAATMMLLTTVFLGIIGKFSRNYLHMDRGFLRFFLLLMVFATGMFILLMGSSYEFIFVGWELVGIASTLLVAYLHDRDNPVRASIHVFSTYRLADIGLLLAIFMLHQHLHVSDLTLLSHHIAAPHPWATPIVLALLVAAAGKSAQLPFSAWLPRAMEGPTPSSALFYGALSVHAGAYLLLRSQPLLDASPVGRAAVFSVGLLTMIHAGLVGRVQTDVKSSLAYATMTQVGLIFALIGLGLYDLASVWLVTHALLRGSQLLRAPSALNDLRAVGYSASAHSLPPWLYALCIERFYLDALADRLLVSPIFRLARAADSFERTLAGGSLRAAPLIVRDSSRSPALAATLAIAAAACLPAQPSWQPALLVALPLAGAAAALALPRYNHRVSILTAAATTALALVCCGPTLRLEALPASTPPWWAFQLDGMNAILVPLTAALSLAVIIALPNVKHTPRILGAALLLEGATLGLLAAHNLALMALFWTIHLAAIAWLIAQGSGDLAARARAVRRFASHAALSSLTFAAGVALLAAHVGVHALSMNSLTALELEPAVQLLAGSLFVVAALSRGAIFPFHTWLLPALDAAPYIAGVSLVGLPLGAYVLAHVVLPITPDAGATLMAACVTLATAQIVYGALLAIVQRSLSRTVSAVALSLSGLSLLGISEVALMTLDGAILLALATGITLSGLLLVIATLRERAGTTDIARLGGLVHTMPRLTAWCFIFSVATFGIPGSLSFIAGDLILQGTYATHPVIAIIVLSCAALNGITLVRAWSLTFLGQPRAASLVAAQRPAVVDLRRAEHAVAFAIALVALLLGLMPARIIDAEERDAIKLVQQHDNNAHQDHSVATEEPRHDH